jgi:putative Holliday junction resolvase
VKRALALDVGTKTIGVAATDARGTLSFPVCTVARRSLRLDAEQVVALVRQRSSEVVVVGLPLELDGREERSARLARQVGEAVRASTGLPVVYVDERYTSVDAERMLRGADVKRQRRREIIDQAAAMLILDSWIALGRPEGSPAGAEGS